MHAAAYNEFVGFIKAFLNEFPQFNLNSKDSRGETALHIACRFNRIGFVQEFVSTYPTKVKLYEPNDLGQTPLHVATSKGFLQIVDILLPKGRKEEVNLKDKLNFTPLLYALKDDKMLQKFVGKQDVVDFGVKSIVGLTALHLAVLGNQTKTVESLVRIRSVDINSIDDMSSTPLHYAIMNDREDIVKILLNNAKIDVNAGKFPPIHLAVSLERENIAELLMNRRGFDANLAAFGGQTPLHVAAAHGRNQVVRALLQRGANEGAQTKEGLTPLHLAIAYKMEETAHILIESNSNISARTSTNKTPFMIACEKGAIKTAVEIFNKVGRNTEVLDEEDYDKNRALHLAALNGRERVVQMILETYTEHYQMPTRDNVKMPSLSSVDERLSIKTLLDNASKKYPKNLEGEWNGHRERTTLLNKITRQNSNRETPLDLASAVDINSVQFLSIYNLEMTSGLSAAVSARQLAIVKYYLTLKPGERELNSALHLASSKGYTEIVEALLSTVQTLGNTEVDWKTALYEAKNLEIVKLLIEKGAKTDKMSPVLKCQSLDNFKYFESDKSVSVTGENGKSVLFNCSSLEIVRYLVETKLMFSDIEYDVFEEACCHSLELVKYYMKKFGMTFPYSEDSFVGRAIECDRMDIVEYLFDNGPQFHKIPRYNSKLGPPCAASRRGSGAEFLRYLWDKDMFDRLTTCGGEPLVYLAAENGNSDAVKFLSDKQADINTPSQMTRFTPLMVAAKNNKYDVVEFLVEKNANTNAVENQNGDTALLMAMKQGNWRIVKYLVDKGANANARNRNKESPLTIALKNQHCEIAQHLIQYGNAKIESSDLITRDYCPYVNRRN